MTAHDPRHELLFLPLGGVGEFGANLALYGFGGKWLMVDCGLSFADETMPGVDVLVPDPSFIVERKDKLVGLVLTHAHEDHLGALPYLWPRLECPVYATPFTAALARRKLDEAGLLHRVPLHVVAIGGRVNVGPFEVSYVPVTHSILEAHSLAIKTPVGTVVHSGDWKLDGDPRVGGLTDEPALRALGDAGVLALIGDSTNALVPGHSGSEGSLVAHISDVVKECKGAVAATMFASNAARISTIAQAATANDRVLVVAGRSLWRTIEAARECGYLRDLPPLLDEDEGARIPREHVLYLLTGCQGEPRGAMTRVATGEHRNIHMGRGDTVIFSSKVIPGNERSIGRVVNHLIRGGVNVVTEKDRKVHVSGHPYQDELRQMLRWLRPKIALPVHGELRNLARHAELSREEGVAETLVIEDGALVRLAPGPAEVIDQIPTQRLPVGGSGPIAAEGPALLARRRMMFNGSVVVMLVLGVNGELAAAPRVVLRGVDLPEGGEASALATVAARVADLPRPRRMDDEEVNLAVRQALRSEFRQVTGQRPGIDVEIVRLGAPAASRVSRETETDR